MAKRLIQALALAAATLTSNAAFAQPQPPAPLPLSKLNLGDSKYAVNTQAGEWLICVQTFKDDNPYNSNGQKGVEARLLAEELVECIRQDYKLPAFTYDRGRKEREEEEARIQKIREQYEDSVRKMRAQGIEPVEGSELRIRRIRSMPNEYAVLVGKPGRNLKDMDAARDFLDDIRKLKPPPNKFSNKAVFADDDPNGKKVKANGVAYVNPFMTAIVVHNPSIPFAKQQDDPEKADDFLKALNSNNEYNLLKVSKPWTLVVKVYQGQTVMQPPKSPSLMERIGLSKKQPELLNANGAQAMATCEFLRKMKPSFDAYVMHGRSYSLVTVGEYESPNDPNLLAAQRTLAGLQIKDQGKGIVLETLNPQPLPMKIPR